jgi:hypothetical protein
VRHVHRSVYKCRRCFSTMLQSFDSSHVVSDS